MATIGEVFGRFNAFGTVDVLYIEDGQPATSITDAPEFIKNINHTHGAEDPVGSVRYQHDKIVITKSDAVALGLEIEE